ncbi:Carboxymuconolactone decarboxylase, putative [Trichomonas vaginalis G3]|uniref:Carboxymuconolactone decarboxylase, putative n=1 Tax=Trichomonas vaginalis (strain ATCC PRA-98 / G3) TaxID=412133 RepID=A2ERL9_TRIV3|nr:4-carboxymuconolactone decarboxylase family protein family [Trichomonas vaginalis G3]EAY04671.1 Carboxymuconolactone decarboxylase, putative [Trichomonas vaginalis G3]KAI5530920.1 4-carboxymuconolactone decarboxylase family protein family [Trichomonas vaginalis G3]|eukprot:XP_001316894.1 Carboxymuconolactone decarboxylase [Trichomonas vaginalis G3]
MSNSLPSIDPRIPDAEFLNVFNEFENDVKNEIKVENEYRIPAILAILIGSRSIDYFPTFLDEAVSSGITITQIKEIIYQGIMLIGMAHVYPFLKIVNEHFNISEPADHHSTVTKENRKEKGIEKLNESFGFIMNGLPGLGPMSDWLMKYYYGELYTRDILSMRQRELILLCFLSVHGDSYMALSAHVMSNINVGNDKEFLKNVFYSLVPYMGSVKAYNAIKCIDDWKSPVHSD